MADTNPDTITLDAVLRARPLLSPRACGQLVHALLDALAPLHARGELQHSIDPRALWLTRTAQGFEVRDLGPRHLSPHPPRTLIRDGVVEINPRYVSPEQIRGEALEDRAAARVREARHRARGRIRGRDPRVRRGQARKTVGHEPL